MHCVLLKRSFTQGFTLLLNSYSIWLCFKYVELKIRIEIPNTKICVNIEATSQQIVNQKWAYSIGRPSSPTNQPILALTRAHQNHFQASLPSPTSLAVSASPAHSPTPPRRASSGHLPSLPPPALSSPPRVVRGFGPILGFVMPGCWVWHYIYLHCKSFLTTNLVALISKFQLPRLRCLNGLQVWVACVLFIQACIDRDGH